MTGTTSRTAVRTARASHGSKAENTGTRSGTRVESVMRAARASGLMGEKSARLGGRFSPALVEQAKRRTGIEADTDLLEFALANIALEDDFATNFRKLHGTVDPDLDLDF